MVLCKTGELFAAGANTCGQLGIGSFTDNNTWSKISLDLTPEDWCVFISAGRHTAIALSFLGTVFTAGLQVGDKDPSRRPARATTFQVLMQWEPTVGDLLKAHKPALLAMMNKDPTGARALLWQVGKRKDGRVVDVEEHGVVIEAIEDASQAIADAVPLGVGALLGGRGKPKADRIVVAWPHDVESVDEVEQLWFLMKSRACTDMGWDAAPDPNPNIMDMLAEIPQESVGSGESPGELAPELDAEPAAVDQTAEPSA
jgi:hypothetical protein